MKYGEALRMAEGQLSIRQKREGAAKTYPDQLDELLDADKTVVG